MIINVIESDLAPMSTTAQGNLAIFATSRSEHNTQSRTGNGREQHKHIGLAKADIQGETQLKLLERNKIPLNSKAIFRL